MPPEEPPAHCWLPGSPQWRDDALDTRAFIAGSGGQLRSRSGRELEQKRGTSRQHGAGRVSRAQRSRHTLLRVVHGASAERNRRQLESCQPRAHSQREARTGQRCNGVRRERAGGLRDGVFSGRRRDHAIRSGRGSVLPAASKSTIISELFNEPEINQTVWNAAGGAVYHAGTRRPDDERRQRHRRRDHAGLARSDRDGRHAAAGSWWE